MQPAAFAGGVIGAIDRFLDIAARFFQDFAHFAGHVAGVLCFVANQNFADAKKNLGAARRRRVTPGVEGFTGGSDGGISVLLS
jgi:hypothetical protein